MAAVISGIVGGGSISAALPKVAPEWYRPNPYTELMAREANQRLEREIRALDQKFELFILAGPALVRANQEKMLEMLAQLHDDILKTGIQCDRTHRHEDKR